MLLPWFNSTILIGKIIRMFRYKRTYHHYWIMLLINSLSPAKLEWNFRHAIFKQILVIDGWGICCEIALIWMILDLTDDLSTLVRVMAWCRQASSHYLSQCWSRSLSSYGVTRPQWVKLKRLLRYVDSLVQDYTKSIAKALELLQSCIKPSGAMRKIAQLATVKKLLLHLNILLCCLYYKYREIHVEIRSPSYAARECR